MSMQFSDVLTIYFVIAVVLVGGGAIEMESAEILSSIVIEDEGGLQVNESITEEADDPEDSGILANLAGPLKEQMDNVFGGGLIVGMAIVTDLLKFLAWPVAISYQEGMPMEIQLLAATLVFSLVLGTLKVVRASA